MIGIQGSWQILQKTRELLSSSRQLLQQMNNRFEDRRQSADQKATNEDSFPPQSGETTRGRK